MNQENQRQIRREGIEELADKYQAEANTEDYDSSADNLQVYSKEQREKALAEIDAQLQELQKPIREPTKSEIKYKVLKDIGRKIVKGLGFIPGAFYLSTYLRRNFERENEDYTQKDLFSTYIPFSITGIGLTIAYSLMASGLSGVTFNKENLSIALLIQLSGIATNIISGAYEYIRFRIKKEEQLLEKNNLEEKIENSN